MSYITILGKATAGASDKYGLTLSTDDAGWVVSEPGSASKIFITKKGKYIYKEIPDKGTYLNDASGKVVCFLRNLVPDQVKKGESGNGYAFETGRTVDWKVDSI